MLEAIRKLLCRWNWHRYVAWEGTTRKIRIDASILAIGILDLYFWQEMCSRCFKINWNAGKKKPRRIGAGKMVAAYDVYYRKKIEKLLEEHQT